MKLDPFLDAAVKRVKAHQAGIRETHITPTVSAAEVRQHLAEHYDFSEAWTPEALTDDVAAMMRDWNLHVTHPRYFGLFNPSVFPASVAADLLVAGFNPQLAAWSHAPAANEIEQHTLGFFAARLGLDADHTYSSFTSGGAEANQSGLLIALNHAIPEYATSGLAGLAEAPTLYVTSESHHSIEKAARLSGLGSRAVRTVGVDKHFRMSVPALRDAIKRDRAKGRQPFLVVGTAGTTSGGLIDPLAELANVCKDENLWFHADAAWGGAACLSPKLKSALTGIERADSITWDAHKWLSVPMGAGMFFCAHPDDARKTFGIATAYMPKDVADTLDPYTSTIQWSRRHIGLKVFMSLAALGSDGYRRAIEHQTEMGDLLRDELENRDWRITNNTALPTVCFTREEIESGKTSAARVAELVQEKNFWISPVRLGDQEPVLRACVTSYKTSPEDILALAETVTEVVLDRIAATP